MRERGRDKVSARCSGLCAAARSSRLALASAIPRLEIGLLRACLLCVLSLACHRCGRRSGPARFFVFGSSVGVVPRQGGDFEGDASFRLCADARALRLATRPHGRWLSSDRAQSAAMVRSTRRVAHRRLGRLGFNVASGHQPLVLVLPSTMPVVHLFGAPAAGAGDPFGQVGLCSTAGVRRACCYTCWWSAVSTSICRLAGAARPLLLLSTCSARLR